MLRAIGVFLPVTVAVLIGAVGLSAGPGCIAFPTRCDYHADHGASKPISGAVYQALELSKTTREQIKADIGPRSVELAQGRIWAYAWEERFEFSWFLGAISLSGAGGKEFSGDVSSMKYLLLEFDDDGVLRRKRIQHGGRLNGLATGWDDAMMKQ